MGNVIIWADIPVVDLKRAMKFHGHVTGDPVTAMPGRDDVAVINGSGAEGEMVVSADLYVGGGPGAGGATVYLNTKGDIDGALVRVVEAGGEVLQAKQFMGEMVGWIAFFRDSEGNRIGLQQPGDATE
ncbi:MAG TPA: VOC family protein [Coriobacteriia bacterium]